MNSTTGRIKSGPLAPCLLVAGLVGLWASAANGIRHWPNLTFMLRVCDAVFLATGMTLLAAGAWLFLIGTKQRTVSVVGAVAAGVFVVALAAGIRAGVIPCSSPG